MGIFENNYDQSLNDDICIWTVENKFRKIAGNKTK